MTETITRRLAIQSGLAALALSGPAAAAPSRASRNRLAFGINLYILPDHRADLDGTLAALARIGYREIEASLGAFPAERIRDAISRAGLRCPNVSISSGAVPGPMTLGTDPAVLAKAARTIGADYLTCNLFPLPPGVSMASPPGESIEAKLERVSRSMNADHWRRTADLFNRKGAELKRHGVAFAYHNHNAELAPQGETNGLAILLEHTDPALVSFNMDAGWVVAAGHDPVALLRAYPGRFRLMHVKDIAPTHRINTVIRAETTEVGSGIVDWPRVIGAAVRSGVHHFIVEQEPPYKLPPIESARRSFAYLSSLRI